MPVSVARRSSSGGASDLRHRVIAADRRNASFGVFASTGNGTTDEQVLCPALILPGLVAGDVVHVVGMAVVGSESPTPHQIFARVDLHLSGEIGGQSSPYFSEVCPVSLVDVPVVIVTFTFVHRFFVYSDGDYEVSSHAYLEAPDGVTWVRSSDCTLAGEAIRAPYETGAGYV